MICKQWFLDTAFGPHKLRRTTLRKMKNLIIRDVDAARGTGQNEHWLAYAGIAIALLVFSSFALFGSQMSGPNMQAHTAIEISGFFAGQTLAVMLLVLLLIERKRYRNCWAICSLASMSLLDGFHALSPLGQDFVWLHSLATCCGGLFMWASTSQRVMSTALMLRIVGIVYLLAIAIGAFSFIAPGLVPLMVVDKQFTPLAQLLNFSGGVGFIFASTFYFAQMKRNDAEHAWTFFLFSLQFGLAGICFVFADIWTSMWWGWHGLRLCGYLLVIAELVLVFTRGRSQLIEINEQLDQRVTERTVDLSNALQRLQQTQRELVQAEKLASLGSMVAGISHELNTPLGISVTVLSSVADRLHHLQDQFEQGNLKRSSLKQGMAELNEGLCIMERSVTRAADLVSSFKQVAVDQTSERVREFDLRQMIDELLCTLQPAWKKQPIEVRNETAPGILCRSLPGSIGQILINLCQNAVLHAFDGRAQGLIRIVGARTEAGIEIRVIDDGAGISPETLPRIFEPFYTTKLGQGGSGLGLSVSHRIATTILGGELEVTSTVGNGTTFYLRLPL